MPWTIPHREDARGILSREARAFARHAFGHFSAGAPNPFPVPPHVASEKVIEGDMAGSVQP